jgi:hypothetical protein
VHSWYRRRLADVALAGQAVTLRLRVLRFFCDNTGCAARTFVEQVAGLTVMWARRTSVAASVLCAIGLALAGRAGARLAGRLGLPASRATLLRLVRKLPDRAPAVLTRIGVTTSRHGAATPTALSSSTSTPTSRSTSCRIAPTTR